MHFFFKDTSKIQKYLLYQKFLKRPKDTNLNIPKTGAKQSGK